MGPAEEDDMSDYGEAGLVDDSADGQEPSDQWAESGESAEWGDSASSPAYGETPSADQWPEGQDQADPYQQDQTWPSEGEQTWTGPPDQAWTGDQEQPVQAWGHDLEQPWSDQPVVDTALSGDGSAGIGADTMTAAAYAAQYPGAAAAQNTSTPKVEFASEPAVNGSQMEFKVRNEGWISIEPMTKLGSYTVTDAGGKVVHGPVTIRNTIEIESGRKYEVSDDIENIPYPIGALPDGDYTAKIELVAGARRSMKFKKDRGKVKPR